MSNLSIGKEHVGLISNIRDADSKRVQNSVHISSSKRVIKPSDDIVSSAIASKKSLEVNRYIAILNSAISTKGNLADTESNLNIILDNLTRMRALALQSNTVATYSVFDRANLNEEFQSLRQEVNRLLMHDKLLSNENGIETDNLNKYRSDNFTEAHDKHVSFLQKGKGFGGGIEYIKPNNIGDFSSLKFTYDSKNFTLTVNDINTGATDRVILSNQQIKSGTLEYAYFPKMDISIALNGNFNKFVSFGQEYANLNDPNNKNNALVNEGFVHEGVDLNGNTVEKFRSSKVKIVKMNGNFTNLGDIKLKIDNKIFNTKLKVSEGGDTIKLKINSMDGADDFKGDLGLAFGDLIPGKKYTVELSRLTKTIRSNGNVKDTIVVEFVVDKNILDATDKVKIGESFAVLNELKNTKIFNKKIEDFPSFRFNIGAGKSEYDVKTFSMQALSLYSLGLDRDGLDLMSKNSSQFSMKAVTNAINVVIESRGKVAIAQNEVDRAVNNISMFLNNDKMMVNELVDLDIPAGLAEMAANEIRQTASTEIFAQSVKKISSMLLGIIRG